jgi:hypothetical protein
VRLNSRDLCLFWIFARAQLHEPVANGSTKRFDRQSPVFFREEFELEEPCLKEIAATQDVCAGIMVKGCGNLNQSLKEHLFGILSLQPHLFPMFMGVIKMPGIKRVKSFLKHPIFRQGIHRAFPAQVTHQAASRAS